MIPDSVARAARWAQIDLTPARMELLQRYATWLREEAIPAGGLGPNEAERIWPRHIADSLLFAAGWKGRKPPERLIDLGSGVGLPGIPLATAWPDVDVVLLDRSRRRMDLAQRAIRVIGLSNAKVLQTDASDVGGGWEGAVIRGAFQPTKAVELVDRVVDPQGTAVIGLSRCDEVVAEAVVALSKPRDRMLRVATAPEGVLDGPVSLLIMSPRGI